MVNQEVFFGSESISTEATEPSEFEFKHITLFNLIRKPLVKVTDGLFTVEDPAIGVEENRIIGRNIDLLLDQIHDLFYFGHWVQF